MIDENYYIELEKNFHIKKEEAFNYLRKMEHNLSLLERHIVPDSYPDEIELFEYALINFSNSEITRERIISKSSFPLISKDWLSILANYLKNKKCIEVMSGSGMLSYGLKELGIDIIATDNKSWDIENNIWTDIEELDAIEAIKKYGKDRPYIIMSWPEMNNTAYKVLKEMRIVNPEAQMIYIGEFGDCCADDNFVRSAEIIKKNFVKEINEKLKSWSGIHDLLLLIK